jgi:hypothetical protein
MPAAGELAPVVVAADCAAIEQGDDMNLKHILLAVAALLGSAPALAQTAYATPEAAADALVDAVSRHDTAALSTVLGKNWQRLMPPDGVDPEERQAFLDKARENRAVTVEGEHAHLAVGNDAWTFPVPLTRTTDSRWRFDLAAGRDAIVERRIGANERAVIQAAQAYVDAQREYASADRNGDGVLEYARRFISSTSQRDGLIWSPALGGQSPLGENYVPRRVNQGYHGYRFRILESQGPAAPGGARSYLIGKRLQSGFAAVAWPVTYGRTGVMTFIVNQDGVVWERDLGPDTANKVKAVTRFDPAEPWRKVAP